MTSSFIINNARLVTPEGLREGSLRVDNGIITAINEGRGNGMREIDAHGNYLFPGFIDIHSDAIEKGIEPRPNTLFPVDIAVHELDKKLAACGITTIFHSLSFAEMEVGLRSNSTAARIIRQISTFRHKLKVRTKIHARFEITDLGALPFLESLIRDRLIHLFSFMDHSPGQGQFRSILAFKNYFGPVYGKTNAEMDTIIHRKLKAKEGDAQQSLQHLLALCKTHGITVASHDDDSPEKIEWLAGMGVSISEFPVNFETVRSAREHGVNICLGSPNIVRGISQAHNLSAREAISRGYGDIICSDYSPMTMLHAVFALQKHDILPLHQAVNMASLNPAVAIGAAGTVGSLEVGKAADIMLVDHTEDPPRIVKTFIAGREVYATC